MTASKPQTELNEHDLEKHNRGDSIASYNKEKQIIYLPASDEEYAFTWKTWCVVMILALSYGISFWIVPSAAAAQTVIATQLGDATKSACVEGAMLLTFFGTKIGHWKWTLTGSVVVMVVFGALLALATPERKGMMMAFVFLAMTGFGWAQYLSIAFIQFGVDQVELGISGGLAGVARFAGGAVAISVYTTILTNSVKAHAVALVLPAAESAGATPEQAIAILTALPLGAEALAKVSGATTEKIEAAAAAFQQCYIIGLRTTALSSLSFGIVGIIGPLMSFRKVIIAHTTQLVYSPWISDQRVSAIRPIG
ncbi:hypothetical protein LTR62_008109 [Meristemomyces frigidus]|uniref:Uncharacterized protein n=1 Tax=Meristemomyces frigidus TaxID=1508187 RepID=A0AAN7TDW8_9PEZI|nr:hypothetical protein LTR62_008109 [Meristemomyces frigidus]